MDLALEGRVAVVTGATRGIGRAIADAFAQEGAAVAICARNAEQVEDAVAAYRASGVRAFGEAVDISDTSAVGAFVRNSAAALGGLDILVANASALVQGNSEDAWRAVFAIDVLGAVSAFEAARPFLEAAGRARGDASFVMIGSTAGAETDRPNAYGAMKAALVHFAKAVAREGAPRHVRCNIVSPGTVYFDGGVWAKAKHDNPAAFEQALARNPTGRMASAEEVAASVVFLASPRSAFTTGINLVIDGALTRRVNF